MSGETLPKIDFNFSFYGAKSIGSKVLAFLRTMI